MNRERQRETGKKGERAKDSERTREQMTEKEGTITKAREKERKREPLEWRLHLFLRP